MLKRRSIGWLAGTIIAAVLACSYAVAQNAFPTPAGSNANGEVAMCRSAANSALFVPCDTTNPLAVNATVTATASITGFPTTQSTGTPIAVTTGGVTGTLPGGTVVVATNVGATNGAYCKLGASASTSDQFIAPNGGWFAFTVGASTQLTCITSTSTTTVNMVGGTGLPTGTGGGGGAGGGGSSAITTWAGGTLGAMANYGTSPGAVLVPGVNAFVTNTVTANATLSAETTKVIGTVNQGTSPWTVGGASATGSALAGNPVRVGLSDGTNAQNWLTASILGDGVNGNNTGAVGNWLFNGTTWDRQRGTTLGTWGIIRDAAGNARGANVNASSQLSVSCDNGCSATTAITSWAGSTLGAITTYGTAPGAVLVPSVNAFVTNTNVNLATNADGVAAVAANAAGAGSPVNSANYTWNGSTWDRQKALADPCSYQNKTNLAISQNGTSSVQLVALSGSTVIYVCSIFLMTNSTATTVALTTGTGTGCVTGNDAVVGSTTANIANSMNLIAGAGFTLGNGTGTVAKGAAASELCMILGSNVFVSGNITYVQQ